MTNEEKQLTRYRIGQRISELRIKRGWSITELAERAGLQRSHVSRIEAGHYSVTIETVQAIAEAFDKNLVIE